MHLHPQPVTSQKQLTNIPILGRLQISRGAFFFYVELKYVSISRKLFSAQKSQIKAVLPLPHGTSCPNWSYPFRPKLSQFFHLFLR